MGWKGNLVDIPVWVAGKIVRSLPEPPVRPRSIFVLRNNDIGDLLTTTPLFDALRRRYPDARLVAGVGDWNRETLRNNPFVDDVLTVNAPWNNKYVSAQTTRRVARYIWRSSEAQSLAGQHFDIGIDILGSHVGAALMMRAGIPYRLGVRGYRGGHVAMQQYVPYRETEHVSRFALRFAELLGQTDLPPARPQVFLIPQEKEEAGRLWPTAQGRLRVLVGPGAGLPEKIWPLERYAALLRGLSETRPVDLMTVGGSGDKDAAQSLAGQVTGGRSLAGSLSLRQTFAVTASADLVLCSSSMLMHVAAAFCKPNAVLLGSLFPSARLHQAQWGYDTCRSLGQEPERQRLTTPEEALAAVQQLLQGNTLP